MASPSKVPGLHAGTLAREAAPLLVRSRLADVRRAEAAAAALDPDGVHDMRVAIRRLRAALRLFGGGRQRHLDREVEAVQDALGTLRDAQVQLAWLAEAGRDLPAADRERLRRWLAGSVDELGARTRKGIRAWDAAIAPRVDEVAGELGRKRKLGGKKMRRKLSKHAERLERRAAAVLADPTAQTAHRLRIAAKKARYVAELLEPALGGQARVLLDVLVPLQDALGALHDADVRLERLQRAAADGGGRDRAAARRLAERLAAERDRLATDLVATLKATRFSGSRRSRRAS